MEQKFIKKIDDLLISDNYNISDIENGKNEVIVYEQMTGKEINSGYILFGKKAKVSEVTIDERLKATVLNIVSEIHNTIESSLLPLSSSSENKCCQCEFFNFCADRF